MGRPLLGERPMSPAERKRRQVALERSGARATNAAIDKALVRLFLVALQARPRTPVLEIAREVMADFPEDEQERVAARLALVLEG